MSPNAPLITLDRRTTTPAASPTASVGSSGACCCRWAARCAEETVRYVTARVEPAPW